MKLVHYSESPISKLRSVPWHKRGARLGGPVGDKPRGLWVSDDDEEPNWRTWCESEKFGLDRLLYKQEIVLSSRANVLFLRSSDHIDAFTKEYGDPLFPPPHPQWIDWRAVGQDKQGIIITPYCWDRRLSRSTSWYHGWDCAAGVIWDADAVARICPAEALVGGLVRVERSRRQSLVANLPQW